MNLYTRGYALINLDAIMHNINAMKQKIGKDAKMMVVIKADGYGHGALPVAKTLENLDYIWGFAVATLDEAVALRRGGITKDLLVLGCVFPDQYDEIIKENIQVTIYNKEMAIALSQKAVLSGEKIWAHMKIDTGMCRLGFECHTESLQEMEEILNLESVQWEGIFTHFAKADERNKAFTKTQLERFETVIQYFEKKGKIFPLAHASNSAGILDVSSAHFNLVRAGIATYGLYPSDEVDQETVSLQPALSFHTHIASIKEIKKGTPISYGGTYIAASHMRIATIPIGYADGYPRSLSNKGYVLIAGKKAKILGRICMDQFMVDVTHIKEAAFASEVVLIGESNAEEIRVETLSEYSQRFNYEFVCLISKRIPRVYVSKGKREEQLDCFS